MFLSALLVLVFASWANSCSNLLLTRDAMSDQANTVSYNADSAALYGSLYHYPATKSDKPGTKTIYDWDSGVYLGDIDMPPETYNVVANANEHGLIIGETTFGGVPTLQSQPTAKIDYGGLIWTTLQTAKNAREAISTIDNLMQKYGYYSEGESFSIADDNEVWMMEIIGKGEYELGAVWVAHKIPQGYVAAHANQARITTFAQDDPENVLYAKDVVTFAQKIGLYPRDGSSEDFSFSDVYDPVTFEGARFCEARVFSFFGAIMGKEFRDEYWDYAAGYNLTNRMPLYVKPPAKLDLAEAMEHMRNHYEGTYFDMTGRTHDDVGAKDSSSPMRAHPLTWSNSKGDNYFMERPIATPQTGWNFVAQSRAWMPAPLKAVTWFGVDDSSTTVRFPIHGGATAVPPAFAGAGTQDGHPSPLLAFNWNSAFTVFNMVANFAYSRWATIYPDVKNEILRFEKKYFQALVEVDEQATVAFTTEGRDKAMQIVTEWSVKTGDDLVQKWGAFFGQLFMKYRDEYEITPQEGEPSCGCAVDSPPYEQQWYDRIASTTGNHYKVPDDVATTHHSLSAENLAEHRAAKRKLLSRK